MNPSSVSGFIAGEGGDDHDLPFCREAGKVLCFCAAATVKNARRGKRRELFSRTHVSCVSVAGGGSLPCAVSPRSLISRLLVSSIRKRPTDRINAREEKAVAAELQPQPVTTPVDGSEIDAGKNYSSGKKTDELCLNLGMGFALSFLFTRSSSEINKMIELRKQMEILLEEIKLESQNNQNYKFSFHEPQTESKSARDFNFNNRRKDLKMEEEFVELEDQKSLHRGVSAKELRARLEHLVQTRRQEGIVELESSIHCTGHEASDTGEVMDGKVFAGVSAPELERKLHELLDSRQKERIIALECALDRAKLKIHQKEREACRWRCNARLISER